MPVRNSIYQELCDCTWRGLGFNPVLNSYISYWIPQITGPVLEIS